MRIRNVILLAGALSLTALHAATPTQWDAVGLASGWSRLDMTRVCTFYDQASQQFRTWSKDGMVSGSIPAAKLAVTPERWVLDPTGGIWVVSGTTLLQLGQNGKVGTSRSLPAEVSDIAWDATCFYLAYKGTEPYVEQRSFKNGSREWSYGKEPAQNTGPSLCRLAVADDGRLLVTHGSDLGCTVLDPAKGKPTGTITCATLNGLPAPELKLENGNRGVVGFWFNRNAFLYAVRGSQLPKGVPGKLYLVRLDLTTREARTIPLDLTDDYLFVGTSEDEAILVRSKDANGSSGLAIIPIQ